MLLYVDQLVFWREILHVVKLAGVEVPPPCRVLLHHHGHVDVRLWRIVVRQDWDLVSRSFVVVVVAPRVIFTNPGAHLCYRFFITNVFPIVDNYHCAASSITSNNNAKFSRVTAVISHQGLYIQTDFFTLESSSY